MPEYNGYSIEGDRTFGMTLIKTIGHGGSLPDCLQGQYTTPTEARKAVDIYLRDREVEDNKPAPVKKVKLTPRD